MTLFLGLVTGPHEVEVAVAEPVAAVELVVDGEPVGRLTGAPWKLAHDFGDRLTSHRLEAVARDAAGREVGRAVQLVNVGRSPVATELVLAGWEDGRPAEARVIWRSGEGLEPESLVVTLDGEPLTFEDPEHIPLPAVSADSLHFVTVELTFPGNRRASAQSAFGGRYGFSLATELTAVPLRPAAPIDRPEEAAGWLRLISGEPLAAAAIGRGPADLFVVRDGAAVPGLGRLDRMLARMRPSHYRSLGLAAEDRVFLVSGGPERATEPGARHELFPVSSSFGLAEAPLPRALARYQLTEVPASPQKLANAVAVAGVQAAAGGRRRAVVLIVSQCAAITGDWDGETVRGFLAELRVPLEVWTLTRRPQGATGLCRDAETLDDVNTYAAAIRRLGGRLEEQQVLWVEGRHLLREILIAEAAPVSEVVSLGRAGGAGGRPGGFGR